MASKNSSPKMKQTDNNSSATKANEKTKPSGGDKKNEKKDDKTDKRKDKKHKPDGGDKLEPVDGNLWVW